jgi:prophage antirepressor-like protein
MNNTAIRCFGFDDQLVRVVDIDGAPWFVAIDICRILGIKNNRDAIEKLDDDEKGVALTDTLGGKQDLAIVSESGLYTLILRSRAATTEGSPAHRFRKWVTGDVIPSIRKTGGYAAVATDDVPSPAVSVAEDRLKLEKVHQCRHLFGNDAARALWAELGLEQVPAMHVADAPSERVERNTQINAFIAERIDVEYGVLIPANVLYTAYRQWCEGKGLLAITNKAFSMQIRALGFVRRKSSGIYYCGLRLRPVEASTAAS